MRYQVFARLQHRLHLLTVCLFFAALNGCSPHLGRSIIVTDIPVRASSTVQAPSWNGIPIALDATIVALAKQPGATIDGRFVPLEGAVDAVVGQGLRRRFRGAGASIRHGAPVSLTSRVTEWQMQVYPDFPSTAVEARAVIVVEAVSQTGEIIYRATYTGEANRSGANVRVPQIEETLINAMGHALDEVIADDRLRRAVENGARHLLGG